MNDPVLTRGNLNTTGTRYVAMLSKQTQVNWEAMRRAQTYASGTVIPDAVKSLTIYACTNHATQLEDILGRSDWKMRSRSFSGEAWLPLIGLTTRSINS